MSKAACEFCRFYLPQDESDGLCRRFPPTPTLVGQIADQVRFQSAFPAMKREGWCGEFRDRETVH